MKVCPHCKRPFPPELRVGGKRRQAMVDYLAKHPEGATVWQIMEAVYADDPNGGPENGQIIPVMKLHANKYLNRQGWHIKSSGGHGALYTLVKL